MKRCVILRDYGESDLGVCHYLAQAIGANPQLEIINYDLESDFELKIRSFNGPGDLLIGLVYQRCTEIKREWLPDVDRLGIYIHRDNQWRCDYLTIQPVVERGAPAVLQAPYGVRPWFVDAVRDIKEETKPEIDVIWLGSECYKMVREDGLTRGEYLDRFQDAIQGRFRFERHQKIHNVQDYAKLMNQAKIAIHIHGLAEHCFRFWETLHLGRCLVSQDFEREKLWADPGKLVPRFTTPQEAADICAHLIETDEWFDLRQQQHQWYKANYSEENMDLWSHQVASILFP